MSLRLPPHSGADLRFFFISPFLIYSLSFLRVTIISLATVIATVARVSFLPIDERQKKINKE